MEETTPSFEEKSSFEETPSQNPGQPSEPLKTKTEEKNTGMAIVAYILFFIPLLTDAKKDPFVKYHVKQGLVIFLAWISGKYCQLDSPLAIEHNRHTFGYWCVCFNDFGNYERS